MFYTGLAFWLLFMMAPIRAVLGVVRRRRPAPATGLSYHRCLGGKRLGPGEAYAPMVPKACSRKFKQKVAATFAQLAPSAFLSMDPDEAEETAAAVARGGKGGAAAGGGGGAQPGGERASSSGRVNLRASLAAGMQGTWDLLWRPHDADHPDDVFVRPEEAPAGARVVPPRRPGGGSVGSSDAGGAAGTPGGGRHAFIAAVRAQHAPASAPRLPGSAARGAARRAAPTPDPFSPLGSGLPCTADLELGRY